MKNVIFDMETGDPDDLITLLMLLNNPNINLKAVTCYEGSALQVGLIEHVISLSEKVIPVGGWNTPEKELNKYYETVLGNWKSKKAVANPVEVLNDFLDENTMLLTGAPLTNIAKYLTDYPNKEIQRMTTQGGYLGNLVPEEKRLEKFKNRKSIRTYNLTNDTDAFTVVNDSKSIKDLTFVTKDLCHGFLYTKEIYQATNFGKSKIAQLLKKSLNYYVEKNVPKAMHDPLAMLFMLYPDIGVRQPIKMNFQLEKNHKVFSSISDENSSTYGMMEYDKDKSWNYFKEMCEYGLENNFIEKKDINLKNKI